MYQIKSSVFLNLTKNQKASLCSHLRLFVKKFLSLTKDDIVFKFIEEEQYYYDIGNPHFYFVIENLDDENFISDLKRYIDALLFDIEYKKSQKPLLDKQKEFLKQKRKELQIKKMKNERPSEKQLKYYKNLCKNHNIEPKNTENASKFDLRSWIGEILDKNE